MRFLLAVLGLAVFVLPGCASTPPPEPISTKDRLISVRFENTPVMDALDEITRKAGFNVVINSSPSLIAKSVTFTADSAPALDVLDAVAKSCGLQVIAGKYDIFRVVPQ